MNEEILKERERIKAKVLQAQTSLIKSRQELKSSISKRRIPLNKFNNFVEYIIFWIDNPDYIRIKDRVPQPEQTSQAQPPINTQDF